MLLIKRLKTHFTCRYADSESWGGTRWTQDSGWPCLREGSSQLGVGGTQGARLRGALRSAQAQRREWERVLVPSWAPAAGPRGGQLPSLSRPRTSASGTSTHRPGGRETGLPRQHCCQAGLGDPERDHCPSPALCAARASTRPRWSCGRRGPRTEYPGGTRNQPRYPFP